MSKKMLSMLVAVAFAAVVTTAQACPGCKGSSKAKTKTVSDKASPPCSKSAGSPCSKGAPCKKDSPCNKGAAKLVSGDANPHMDAILAKLPKMTYKVGDETACCSKSAALMAEKTHKPLVYLVADKEFTSEGDAKVALTTALEAEIANLKSMQFAVGSDCVRCPITAKSMAKKTGGKVMYRVAGFDFDTKDKAEKAVKLVADAAESVTLKYKVGEKSFCCDKMAGSASKESGKKMTFLVGDEETACPTTAQLMLTKAKVHAIIAAAAAAIAL